MAKSEASTMNDDESGEVIDGNCYIPIPKPEKKSEPTSLSKSVLKRLAAMGKIYEPGYIPASKREPELVRYVPVRER